MKQWLQIWLEINPALKGICEDVEDFRKRIESLEGMQSLINDLTRKQAELNASLKEVRELREMIRDPRRIPIKTRTTQQFRTLVEEESPL